MCIGDFLCCDHKLNKCLLFIARLETEALPTRFLSDCKNFLSLFFLLFCILFTVLMKIVKWRVNTFILIFVRLYTVFQSWIFLFVKPVTTLFFTSWKWLPFFWFVAQTNGVLENEKSVMSFLKYWNMKHLKWLSLYFHINHHCFYFKVSASVNSVNTTIFSEGEDAILFCDVSGVPPPVVSWFNDNNKNVYNGSLWKLLSINRSYNGTYQCIASNACGMDSKTFDIIVQCKF